MAPKKTTEATPFKKQKTEPKPAAPPTPSTPGDEETGAGKSDAKDFANFAYHNSKRQPLVAAALVQYRNSTTSEKKAIIAKWKADKSCSWTSEFVTTNTTEHARSSGVIKGFMSKYEIAKLNEIPSTHPKFEEKCNNLVMHLDKRKDHPSMDEDLRLYWYVHEKHQDDNRIERDLDSFKEEGSGKGLSLGDIPSGVTISEENPYYDVLQKRAGVLSKLQKTTTATSTALRASVFKAKLQFPGVDPQSMVPWAASLQAALNTIQSQYDASAEASLASQHIPCNASSDEIEKTMDAVNLEIKNTESMLKVVKEIIKAADIEFAKAPASVFYFAESLNYAGRGEEELGEEGQSRSEDGKG